MSVAFRRESDEEHLEPKFELPIPAGPNLVTARGLALIDAKVAELEAAIETETDDAARDGLKRDLRYWHTRQTTAELAPEPEDGEIGIGSVVRVRMNGAERRIAIVGGDEAEPGADRLAFSAPLARALMGAMVGETVAFGGKDAAIAILDIEE